LIESHEGHKIEDLKVAQSNDFVVNLITNFYNKIKRVNEEQLKNFSQKISDSDIVVENFFKDEIDRVEKTSKEMIILLNNLNAQVLKLISTFQEKFKKEFVQIKENYERFQDEFLNCKFF
jgi:succinate dehydrogenase flavin-adding protein (antitoxin of CptAB toxin-antitoxin module)